MATVKHAIHERDVVELLDPVDEVEFKGRCPGRHQRVRWPASQVT